jgi:hypothetical protein
VKKGPTSSPTSHPIETKENRHHYSSDTVVKIREEFIDEIMRCVKVPDKITRQDVISILDLYAALSPRLKGYITMTLEGRIDNKSEVYNKIMGHVQSKRITLPMLRDIYKRLCEAFGADAIQVVYQVSKKLLGGEKHRAHYFRRISGKNINQEACIAIIVECANPLYPVYEYEVTAIINLYAALPPQLKNYITKILKGSIDSNRSLVFNQVSKYLNSINSDIDTYRKIYSKLSRQAINMIYKIVEIKRKIQRPE